MNYLELIIAKRKETGLSQNAFAKQIGIEQSFMNEIENGKKNPSIKMLFKICRALDIKEIPVPEDDNE